ncbi:hypothetical protein GWO13_09470 [Candidatus Bathyarchaeota archaeon]|nr:hypothetical protein [Candidatus Bathyarchaeota archaeon]
MSSISGLPDIAYENVSFDPTTGTSYVKCQYVPTLRRPAVRGLNPQQRYQGIFAVTVYAPEGNGPATADALANTIIESFEATTDISFTNASSETINLSIDYAERQQGFVDSPWYYIPINIGWYIYK